MANRLFVTKGFWDRIDKAIADSGLPKNQIAKKMGVDRKALYRPSDGSDDRSWHSGRIASFCKITGVSADWLLGLSNRKTIKSPKKDTFSFKVIDKRTGKEPIYDHNHLFKEKWFKESNLIYCDIDSWCISEDGFLILTDDCGNIGYPPQDRFEVVFL
jgi:hypothetical protein